MLTDKECLEIALRVQKAHRPPGDPAPMEFVRAGYAAARAAREQEPVAWRWRANGATEWIYNPEPEWVKDAMTNAFGVELEPLYAHPAPARSQDERKGEA